LNIAFLRNLDGDGGTSDKGVLRLQMGQGLQVGINPEQRHPCYSSTKPH